MPWVRIDENAMDHPKFLALTDGAWRLWCEGQAYCQKHLTDGAIPSSALRGFRYYSPSRVKLLTAELVPGKGPCWHRAAGGGIQVHDYLSWNESRERVLEMREAAKQRMRRARSREHTGEHTGERSPNVLRGVCVGSSPEGGTGETALSANQRAAFERLCTVYPNISRLALAEQAWIALSPTPALADVILADVERRRRDAWATVERRYIPQLRRYLDERQWEEPLPDTPAAEDPYAHLPTAWSCRVCGEVHEGTQAQGKVRPCLAEKTAVKV